MAALAQYGFVPASKLLMREVRALPSLARALLCLQMEHYRSRPSLAGTQWHGLDMGPCRLPLRALSPDEEKRFMSLPVVQELHALLTQHWN